MAKRKTINDKKTAAATAAKKNKTTPTTADTDKCHLRFQALVSQMKLDDDEEAPDVKTIGGGGEGSPPRTDWDWVALAAVLLSPVKSSTTMNDAVSDVDFLRANGELVELVTHCHEGGKIVVGDGVDVGDGVVLTQIREDQQGCGFWYALECGGAMPASVLYSSSEIAVDDVDADADATDWSEVTVVGVHGVEAFLYKRFLSSRVFHRQNGMDDDDDDDDDDDGDDDDDDDDEEERELRKPYSKCPVLAARFLAYALLCRDAEYDIV